MDNKMPVRKKAIETKQKLITTTMQVIAKKGYHNVTVDEIAKSAGMSTGIAYRYFKNKKEMLLAALEYYFSNIQEFSDTEYDKLSEFSDHEKALEYVLDRFYYIHKKYYGIHEELESLRHIDEDIKALYNRFTDTAVDMLLDKCTGTITNQDNLRERIYVGIGILDNYAHFQIAEDLHKEIDIKVMKQLVIKSVMTLFRGEIE